MSRQTEFYLRNKEKILSKKRDKYHAKNPNAETHNVQSAPIPKRSKLERMLDAMDRQRGEY